MQLAPQPLLHGTRLSLASGLAGIRQTLDAMRALVRTYRTAPELRQTATTLVTLAPQKDGDAEVGAIYEFVRDHIRYVRDVNEVETLMTPAITLAARHGDCDDQVTLLATLLEAVGYPTRFIAAGYHDPGMVEHVYLQAFVNGGWLDLDPTEPYGMGWAPPDPVALLIEGVN